MRTIFSPKTVGTLCLIVTLLGGCGETTEDYVSSGKAFLEKRQFASAVIQLRNAVEKAPENADARFLLGMAFGHAGDLPNAEAQIRKALDLGYDRDQAVPVLVQLLTDMGSTSRALDETSNLDRLTSPSAKADVLGMKGDVLFTLKRVEEASRTYDQALSLDPQNPVALAGRARLALWNKDFDTARTISDGVLARNPKDVRALLIRASVLLDEKRTQDAIAVFDRIVQENPAHFFAYTGLIPALLSVNDVEGASQRLGALKKEMPGAIPTMYLEALVDYAKGKKSTARDLVRQVLKFAPDNTRALLLGGMVEHDLGNLLLAQRYLEKLVAIIPEEVNARRLLASSYFRSGQVARSKDLMERLLVSAPNDPEVLSLAGDIALAERRFSQAAGFFGKASSMAPDNGLLRARLGQAHLNSGEVSRGLADLESARAIASSSVTADVVLVDYYLGRKETDKALAAARSMVAAHPENERAQLLMGAVQLATGDLGAARKSFEKVVEIRPDSVEAARHLAELDTKDGNVDLAKSRFSKVLELDPRAEEASLFLAALLGKEKAPPESVIKVLDSAIAANPLVVQSRVAKARIQLATGNARGALDTCQQAVSTIGEDPGILLELARAQTAAKEFTQAVTTYGKLITLMPGSHVPYMGQVEVHAAEKNWPAARSAAARAVEVNPGYLPAYLVLVDSGIQARQFREAQADAQAIQRKWPKLAAGYSAEAQVLLAQNRVSDAERVLRDGLASVPDAALVTRLYTLLSTQNRAADAESFAEAWSDRHPKDVELMSSLGVMALTAKKLDVAEKWFRKAADAQPRNPATLNNLAWTLALKKNPESVALVERALIIAPDNAAMLDTLGFVHLELGHPDRAVAPLRRAVELVPGSPSARIHLARALAAMGKPDEARKELAEVRQLDNAQSYRNEIDELEKGL